MLEFLRTGNDTRHNASADARISRRGMIGGAVTGTMAAASADALFAAAPGHAAAASLSKSRSQTGPTTSDFLFFDDEVEGFTARLRMQRDAQDDASTLSWYHFMVFAVADGIRPAPVVRYEGIELSHHRAIGEHAYRLHGHNLSFPRDLNTGEFTSTTVNPITEQKVEVPNTVLTQDPGIILALDGMRSLTSLTSQPRVPYDMFRLEGDLVKLDGIRVPPDSWPAEFIETSYSWTPRDLFDDKDITSLPTEFAGSYIFPWPAWLEMGDQKGHMFGTWSGKKLASADELPREFRERAEREYPQLLQPDLTWFDKSLEELARPFQTEEFSYDDSYDN